MDAALGEDEPIRFPVPDVEPTDWPCPDERDIPIHTPGPVPVYDSTAE